MKIPVPYYLVALLAAFIYAVVKHYAPELPLTEEQVIWVLVAILAALNFDVVTTLRRNGVLPQ